MDTQVGQKNAQNAQDTSLLIECGSCQHSYCLSDQTFVEEKTEVGWAKAMLIVCPQCGVKALAFYETPKIGRSRAYFKQKESLWKKQRNRGTLRAMERAKEKMKDIFDKEQAAAIAAVSAAKVAALGGGDSDS